MTQFTSRSQVVMNGEELLIEEGASFNPGGVMREGVMGSRGPAGFRVKTKFSEVKCNLLHMAKTDIKKIQDFQNGTIQYVTDIGQTFLISNAFTADVGELVDGKLPVTFQGDPAEQQ